jgi:hypothetical protein
MLVSLCPFPLVLGSASAAPLTSSGAAKAVPAPEAAGEPVAGIPTRKAGGFASVSGVPTEPGLYIVPAIVVSAMRELGIVPAAGVRLFTPAPLKEEGGVKFAPYLIEHFAA